MGLPKLIAAADPTPAASPRRSRAWRVRFGAGAAPGPPKRAAPPRARRTDGARDCGRCRPRPARRSRIDQRQAPDCRQLGLARVDDLDGEHRVAHAQRAERLLPRALLTEVGNHDHEPGLPRQPGDPAERRCERIRVVLAVGATPSASTRRTATRPGLAPRGGSVSGPAAPNVTIPTLPARRHPEASEHERNALGDVGLQAIGGTERHRG